MKILFLSPLIHAEHKIAKSLSRRGAAILFAENPGEAWEILRLHGESIDLGIIHREGQESKDTGLKLLDKIKAASPIRNLPIILTTSEWTDAECAVHQQSPQGANAYLHYPYTDEELIHLIGEILGPNQLSPSEGMVLEDVAEMQSLPVAEGELSAIALEAPDLPPGIEQSELGTQSSGVIPVTGINNSSEFAGTVAIEDSPAENVGTIAMEPEPGTLSTPQTSGFPLAPINADPQTSGMNIPAMALESESLPPVVGATTVLDFSGTHEALPEGTAVIGADEIDALPLTGLSMAIAPLSEDGESLEESPNSPPPFGTQQMFTEQNPPEMPYLFGEEQTRSKPSGQPPPFSPTEFLLHHPLGDAVIPGGAAQSPDIEVMRKYLVLREQDVIALSNQLKDARDRLSYVERSLQEERAKNNDLTHTMEVLQKKLDHFEDQKKVVVENVENQVTELQFELKVRSDKVKVLENQMREKADEMVRLKDRVRGDIRKIRTREKELENKLEMSKKDSESLITSREGKIIELKRKLDLLEFNMDLLQDQYDREKENSAKMRERLAQAAQIVRVAEGLLDSRKGIDQKNQRGEPTGSLSMVDSTSEQKAS